MLDDARRRTSARWNELTMFWKKEGQIGRGTLRGATGRARRLARGTNQHSKGLKRRRTQHAEQQQLD